MKLKDGKCIKQCGNEFYEQVNKDSIECKPCQDKNCEVCNNTSCTNCKKDFFMVFSGKGNKCVETCPPEQYGEVKNRKCEPCMKGCNKCSNGTECEQCDNAFVFFPENKTCIAKCPEGYTSVRIPNAPHSICYKCTDPNATACEENKPDNSVVCKKEFILMPGKKKCEKQAICKDKSYYNAELNTCEQCPKECTLCEDKQHCTACAHGFDPVDGVCNNDCPDKSTFVKGRCVECKDPLCKNCNADRTCIKCETGSFLFEDKCHTQCPLGTFADIEFGVCKVCRDHCKECESAFKCNVCEKGFILFVDGTCVKKCPEKFYENCKGNTQECDKCDISCLTCSGPTEKDCNKCAPGFIT
jgi:proprotein convertase subtilisin/kexin type 5